MIARVSEKPFWGPEEQIRKFINQHDEPEILLDDALYRLKLATMEEIEGLSTDVKTEMLNEYILE